MGEPAAPASLRFLFRTDEGTIGRGEWRRGAAILAVALAAFAAGWRFLAPYANRGLDQRGFIDPLTIVTYVYLIVYAFAAILIAVCYVNLSAKRLRARGLAPGLGGLLPLAALFAGAAHWLQPRVADTMPFWIVVLCDLALVGALAWSILELGARGDGAK